MYNYMRSLLGVGLGDLDLDAVKVSIELAVLGRTTIACKYVTVSTVATCWCALSALATACGRHGGSGGDHDRMETSALVTGTASATAACVS